MIKAQNLSYKIGEAGLLKETNAEFEEGRFHVIMGANGAGKSTLLKLLAGELQPSTGTVFFGGNDLKFLSKRALARRRAVLSQHYHLAFPISVEELVLMGRYPYFVTQPSAKDKAICTEAMRLMDVPAFAERDYTTLSGGEAQKVQMSRVLAQIWNEGSEEQRLLFLDEPVSHLDVKYQHQLMRVAKEVCAWGTTVIAVLHDINLALQFADCIFLMKEGRIIQQLKNPEELTTQLILDTFGISAKIIRDEAHPKPIVVF